MVYFEVIFDNGYCGCAEHYAVSAETVGEVHNWARDYLYEYGATYDYLAFGWEGSPTEEEEEEYLEDCVYDIEEISEELFNDLIEEGYEEMRL